MDSSDEHIFFVIPFRVCVWHAKVDLKYCFVKIIPSQGNEGPDMNENIICRISIDFAQRVRDLTDPTKDRSSWMLEQDLCSRRWCQYSLIEVRVQLIIRERAGATKPEA